MKRQAHYPPGPRPLPFVGNALAFRRDPLKFVRKLQERYGRMARVKLGKTQVIFAFRPEHVRYILIEHPRNFVKPNIAGEIFPISNIRWLDLSLRCPWYGLGASLAIHTTG